MAQTGPLGQRGIAGGESRGLKQSRVSRQPLGQHFLVVDVVAEAFVSPDAIRQDDQRREVDDIAGDDHVARVDVLPVGAGAAIVEDRLWAFECAEGGCRGRRVDQPDPADDDIDRHTANRPTSSPPARQRFLARVRQQPAQMDCFLLHRAENGDRS
jgi:hypothetical protein